VEWYHVNLCHPGKTRTELTIRQYFTWNNLRQTVHEVCSTCDICQRTKRNSKKYGKLPAKEAESIPLAKLCVDMIGPYIIKDKSGKIYRLHCVTMIDPATGWFEIIDVKFKDASTVANAVEQVWLTRYPWPQEIIYDRGSEFMGVFAEMVARDYNIKRRPITVQNPQANAIIERIHQTLGNIIRTFELHTNTEDIEESWSGILSAAMFALRSTIHTTLQATPMQLVFGRDAILNIKFQADWNIIKQRKQKMIDLNNQRENSKRLEYEYKVNDKVLLDVKDITKAKYAKNPYKGPYHVLQVNDNGTVLLDMGHLIDTVNIRNIKPYKE
jgi:transposase InsO family protein